MSDIVFMDTETLGLDINAPIWEFAAVRRITAGPEVEAMAVEGMVPSIEKSLHLFINNGAQVERKWLDELPDEFANDFRTRFAQNYGRSLAPEIAAREIAEFLAGRPHVIGAVPNFDTERIAHQLLRPNRIREPWHYHLIDIENVVVGYLVGVGKQAANAGQIGKLDMGRVEPPWKSDELSRAVGVDPERFERHTAMGDVRWVMAQWDAVMGA